MQISCAKKFFESLKNEGSQNRLPTTLSQRVIISLMIYYDIIYKDQYVYQFKMYVFLEEEEAEEEEEKGEEETEEEEGTLKYGGETFF